MLGIRRRTLVTLLGSAVAWALAARAQQRAMPAIGYLSSRMADSDALDAGFSPPWPW
jgi:hypothetical protein